MCIIFPNRSKLEEFKLYDTEKARLKLKIKELESEIAKNKSSNTSLDASVRRIMTESPIPLQKPIPCAVLSTTKYKSPSLVSISF